MTKPPLSPEAVRRLTAQMRPDAPKPPTAPRVPTPETYLTPQGRIMVEIVRFAARISEDTVRGIREDRANGMLVRDVAAKWKVGLGYVSRIANRQLRRDVE